ncbi:MAG: hypothetical protein A2033_01410 [Bacteroidetes bacterium GWA2_31_9]|nr:MAG: hypothetical protein A2033_01410 [Bacteroidetes bacterium GWA2_31_9]
MLNNQITFPELTNCKLCPNVCGVNRYSKKLGFCKSGVESGVINICLHKGEEPVIGGTQGICNVFFGHCNMQCVFCQNYQISNKNYKLNSFSFDLVINNIIEFLENGINTVGFVSPSHFIPQMKFIIDKIRLKGHKPIIVYNSNAYDNVKQIELLEDYVNIYLPDFKYFYNELSEKFSATKNYFQFASIAIKEMYRQKGSTLITNEEGLAESGLIIRHLVLPNNINNSIKLLEFIAEEISTNVAISLMSQYFPTNKTKLPSEINRKISKSEYDEVLKTMNNYGFSKGWIQDLNSSNNYLPDFNKINPFEI